MLDGESLNATRPWPKPPPASPGRIVLVYTTEGLKSHLPQCAYECSCAIRVRCGSMNWSLRLMTAPDAVPPCFAEPNKEDQGASHVDFHQIGGPKVHLPQMRWAPVSPRPEGFFPERSLSSLRLLPLGVLLLPQDEDAARPRPFRLSSHPGQFPGGSAGNAAFSAAKTHTLP